MSVAVRRYLLDTHILTDLIRNPAGRVRQRIIDVGEANICTSIIVACEKIDGARCPHSKLRGAQRPRLFIRYSRGGSASSRFRTMKSQLRRIT